MLGINKSLEIKIKEDIATLSEKLYVYQNDRGVEVHLKLDMLKKTSTNCTKVLFKELGITCYDATILKPNKTVIGMKKGWLVNETISFTIDEELTDDMDELGIYKIQFHLYDEDDNRITIPPVEFEVKELISSTRQAMVDRSSVGECVVAEDTNALEIFSNGRYIKTIWTTGDLITSDKLNKIECALEDFHKEIEELENKKSDKTHEHSYNELRDKPSIPVKVSDLENDRGFITSEDLDVSQSHIHLNMDELNKITPEKIIEWDGKVDENHTHDSVNVLYNNPSDPGIETIKDALDKLLYFDLVINFSSTSSTSVEKGAILSNVAFNWTYNKEITSQKFNGELIDKSIRTYSYGPSFSSNKTFTLSANDSKKDFSKNVSFNFLNGRYWGVSTNTLYDSDFIKTLSKELSSSRNKTFTVDCKEGQYIFYCIPSTFGNPTFTVGGFSGGFNKVESILFTNSSGFVETYDIWKSTNSNLGNTTVVVS